MSVNSLKPTFSNREGYLAWRKSWRIVYAELSLRIRRRKHEIRNTATWLLKPHMQRDLLLMRADATKMMTLLDEAKERRDRILAMQKSISDQPFPVEIDANRVDLFFNKGSIEFDFLPKWVVQTKGKSFYVDHIDADVPWSTRELDTGSTRGMLRFRKCRVSICAERIATLRAA